MAKISIDDRLRQVGLSIAFYRKARGMSQAQLAEEAGITRQWLADIESVKKPVQPSLQTLCCIADALDIEPARLLEYRDLSSS